MDCIAEGFMRGGKAEFVNFLSIANGSCGEAESQFYRAFDCGYINHEEMDVATQLCKDIIGKNIAFIKYVNTSSIAGSKFKNRVPSTNIKRQTSNPDV